MSEIVKILTHTVDLRQTLEKTDLHTLFVMGDNEAHRFELEILSGSEKPDLTGSTVTGYFTNFKEDTTIKVGGKVEEGRAVVVLSKPCYTLHGQFVLTIQVKSGDAENTVFMGEGYMRRTKGETIIYDDYIVYDVNTLMAHISAMRTATDNANAATTKATNAASAANTAAGNANTKAQAAQTAADAANAAAQNWSNGTAANAIQLNGKDASEYLLKTDAFTMELVWTNEAPSSIFPQQPIVLDTTKYDGFLWQMKSWNGTTYISTWLTMDTKNQKYHTLFAVSDKSYISRSIEIRDSEIYANIGRTMDIATATFTEDNKYAVPVKLYGIKGVGA